MGVQPQLVSTAGHGEQLRAAPRLLLATTKPGWNTEHCHLLLGDRSPSRMDVAEAVLLLSQAHDCHVPAVPATLPSPSSCLQPPGARQSTEGPLPAQRLLQKRTSPVEPELTGKAFPLHTDSLASTDIPLSHRASHRLQPRSVPAYPSCHRPHAGSLLHSPRVCPFTGMEPGAEP